MNLFGLLFIIPGICIIIGSSKIAEYNRIVRNSSIQTKQIDHFCCVLVGIATTILGVVFLFHPDKY